MSNTALERSLLTINKVRDPDREQEEQDLFVFNDTKEGARIPASIFSPARAVN
jgi:hypothetical protein